MATQRVLRSFAGMDLALSLPGNFLAWLLSNWEGILSNPLSWLFVAFQLWMLIDAIRREEWMWVLFILIFPVVNAILYFFLVYRAAPSATRGFELPGAHDRRRIKEFIARVNPDKVSPAGDDIFS